MRSIVLAFVIFLCWPQLGYASIAMVTECFQPQGTTVEFAPKLENWHESKLENTKVSFLRVSPTEYDVIIKDKHGDIFVKSHDPDVSKVYEDEESLTIISTPPIGLVEVFQISTLPDGRRIAIWNIMKNNALPMKKTNVAIYILQCEDR